MISLIRTLVVILSIHSFAQATEQKSDKFENAIQQEKWTVKVSNPNLKSMHESSTLLVSCVDFRLRDEAERFMREELGLLDDYDEIAIPGAALAATAEDYPHWSKTLDDIIGLLKKLHNIKRIIFLDHYGCGAYKTILGAEKVDTKEKEKDEHVTVFQNVRTIMRSKFPDLEVYTLIMGLDGVIEHIKEGAAA